MTVALCTLLSILLFSLAVLTSRDVVSFSPIRMIWGLHGISILLILVALTSRGIWYDADTYLGDLWTASEAVHKTAQGLRSSIDYFSPIGPVQQWLYSTTLFFHAPSAYSVILANVCVAILVLVLAHLLLRHRASALTIAIVGLIGVTTALSPRDIDAPLADIQTSFLGPYNRWSWALLMPVATRAALPFRLADPIGACLWGFALALLFLLKVTYGLAAIGIFLVAQIVQPGRWREGALVALSFGLALLVADVIAGGQVRAYLADLEMTARMPSNGLRLTKLMLEVPAFIVFAFGTFILLFAVTHGDAERVGRPSLQSWRALIVALATGGSGLIVLMQNHYKTEAATLLLMPLIVGEWTGLLALLPTTPEPIWRRRHGDWIALLLVATLALPAIDAGFILAQRVQLIRKAPLVEFARTEFHDLIIEKTRLPDANAACANGTCRDYLRMIRGRSLLRQYCAAKSNPVVLAANFSNPFPALMGWPSPSASPIWLHDGRSFSSVTHIPPHKLLGDVDCLMEAKREPNSLAFMEIYGSHVSQGYLSTGENEDWRIWIRGSSTK